MQKYSLLSLFVCFIFLGSCNKKGTTSTLKRSEPAPFVWEAANMYFLLTDRFYNGDTSNDVNFDRSKETAVLRDFEGGDLKGVLKKIEDNYFTDLGINAIWFTPVVEQVHGAVDEGTGVTYGYHGYWTKDWTQLDPNFGSMEDLKAVVDAAHNKGIKIVMDVVLNHTGPVTDQDPFWGKEWAREDPNCAFSTYENTTKCSLVENLPDILTESTKEVKIPELLAQKWKNEGRYDLEMQELENFFKTHNLAKTPRNYIIKWLTDYVRELGIDAYRVDTTKHVDEQSWVVLREVADKALASYREAHNSKDTLPFFMLGEVYNYSIDGGRSYDFGDGTLVDYFAHGFDNLINFQFKYDAAGDYESLFSKYSNTIHTSHQGKSFTNYATSHDDGSPFDKERIKALETGTKLLLTPGISQVYYGDELARPLIIEGTQGDATLRSAMNWQDTTQVATRQVLTHWQKLGQFRAKHPSIGAGKHQKISDTPYLFKRTYTKGNYTDQVLVGLDLEQGKKEIVLDDAFAKAKKIHDAYSNQTVIVNQGKVVIDSPFSIVLLEAVF